jgi:hypothetical protein
MLRKEKRKKRKRNVLVHHHVIAHLELKVLQVLRVQRVLKVFKVLKVLLAHQVLLEHPGLLVLLDLKVLQEHKDPKVFKVLLDRMQLFPLFSFIVPLDNLLSDQQARSNKFHLNNQLLVLVLIGQL